MTKERRRRRGLDPVDALLLAAMLAGALWAARPLLLGGEEAASTRSVVTQMTANSDLTHDPERMAALREAQAYNLALGGSSSETDNAGLGGNNGTESDILQLATKRAGDPLPYESQLDWGGVSAICWVEIPRIAAKVPAYHGTGDDALALGIGHLEWSSLPVGGTPSHCALAAHSGMESSDMFDDLDRIEQGDLFVLHTLGDAYCYQVYSTEVVLPEDAADRCQMQEGRDLCTLITCTPYGINTHRLLVHGRRVAYAPDVLPAAPVTARVNRRTLPTLALAAGLAALAVATAATGAATGRKRDGGRGVVAGWR